MLGTELDVSKAQSFPSMNFLKIGQNLISSSYKLKTISNSRISKKDQCKVDEEKCFLPPIVSYLSPSCCSSSFTSLSSSNFLKLFSFLFIRSILSFDLLIIWIQWVVVLLFPIGFLDFWKAHYIGLIWRRTWLGNEFLHIFPTFHHEHCKSQMGWHWSIELWPYQSCLMGDQILVYELLSLSFLPHPTSSPPLCEHS